MEDILNKVNDDFSNYVSLFEKRDSLIPSALTLCPKVVHFIFSEPQSDGCNCTNLCILSTSFILCMALQKVTKNLHSST